MDVPPAPAIKIENEHDKFMLNYFIDEVYKKGFKGFPPRMDVKEPLITDEEYVRKVMEAYSNKPDGYEEKFKSMVSSFPQSSTYKEYILAAGAKMPSELNQATKKKVNKKKVKKSLTGKGVKNSNKLKKKSKNSPDASVSDQPEPINTVEEKSNQISTSTSRKRLFDRNMSRRFAKWE